ncbi:MAG: hypothetical protein CVT67_11520 [Actinobacteria bacterium HGW-Actinobacteria-7]|jgi:N-acyl-L-homoserine lactone synthetase|nr:MAG: hypothetical protein CVT67_11520 [Actinobacteria bacterium HGW-Actinobacteria-7]
MQFLICSEPEHIRMAQQLRYDVFCAEKGWIEGTACPEGLDSDEYDDDAIHFIALDDGVPVGTTRVLLGAKHVLPAMKFIDIDALGLEPHEVVEISRLATHKGKRSQDLKLFLGLTHLTWEWCMAHDIKAWLAISDVPLFKLFERIKMPLLAAGSAIDYLGSLCVPAIYDMARSGACVAPRDSQDSPEFATSTPAS